MELDERWAQQLQLAKWQEFVGTFQLEDLSRSQCHFFCFFCTLAGSPEGFLKQLVVWWKSL